MSHLKIVIAREMQEIHEQKARLEKEKVEAMTSGIASRIQHARVLALLIQRMNDDLLGLHLEYNMCESELMEA